MFKHLKGKNGTTTYLPFNSKTGGDVKYIKDKDTTCLTEDQMRYKYEKVEQGNNLNIETMKQEIEQETVAKTETNRENDNPYQKVVLNKVYQDEKETMQMENCSILSNNIRYIQHDEISKTPHRLDINTLDYCQYKRLCNSLKGEESHTLDVDFGSNPEKMRSNY